MDVRLALVSPPDPGLEVLRERMASHPRLAVVAFTSLEAVRAALAHGGFDVVASRVPRFDPDALEMARKLRAALPSAGLLFCAGQTDPASVHRLRSVPRCAAIDEKREIADAAKIAYKLAAGDAVGPRAHPRARRSDPLEIRDATGRMASGRFLDFGPMGARVQAASLGLARKSRLTLTYQSSSGGRVHRIEAAVAWTKPAPQEGWESILAPFSATETLGLRFIAVAS